MISKLLFLAALCALPLAATAAARIHLRSHFKPGETLYYQIETHTSSTGKTTTPIINPEGGTNLTENVDLLVRLDVLGDGAPGSSPANGSQAGIDTQPVRIRLTYERAHADSQTDAPAFDAPPARKQYDRLEGHSLEFTLRPNGAISDLKDVDNILSNVSLASPALSWIKLLASASGYPQKGIVIGQKWVSDSPLDGAPLTGLVWHSQSTYLRNDRCSFPTSPGDRPKSPRAVAQECAVILTEFEIVRRGSAHSDRTPPDYLHHGLRTAGTLTGSGESLDSISLGTGMLVSSAQSSTQRADFDIVDAANGEKIHRVGEVQTHTVITRVPPPPVAASGKP